MLCFFWSLFLANADDSNIYAPLHQVRFMSASSPRRGVSGAASWVSGGGEHPGWAGHAIFSSRRQRAAGVTDACKLARGLPQGGQPQCRRGRRKAVRVTAPQPGDAQDDVIFNEPGRRSRCRAGRRRGPQAEGSLRDTAWGRHYR